MQILAIDARVAMPDAQPFSVAWWTNDGHGYEDDWDAWREEMVRFGNAGYTMVAYGAEQAVTRLLYTHNEYVRADYRGDEFQHARWYYDIETVAMPIWDVRPLCNQMPLKQLAVAVGLEPYDTPTRYTWQHHARWLEPCWEHQVRSCPLCWDVVHKFQWKCSAHNTGECDQCWRLHLAQTIYRYMERYAQMAEGYGIKPSRTLGGMSYRLWRHLDRPSAIRLPTREMDEFARLGYRAGRTECFKLGDTGPVTYGDVSQMYASVLRDIELPTPESTTLSKPNGNYRDLLCLPGIIDATVTAPERYLPVLGVQKEQGYIFPVGTFRGHFTTSELQLALSRGYAIDTMHMCLLGERSYRPFASFTSGMMDWREALRRSNDPLEIAVKGMLNALYGMIGMRAWHSTEYVMPLPPETTMADWPYHDIKVLRDHVLMRRSDLRYRRGQFANPLWAALITAAARIKLYLLMEQCGNDLVYCDTDSLITMGELPEDANEPGRMRYQGFFSESVILAPKLYRLQDGAHGQRMAHAGIPAWQMHRLIEYGHAKTGNEIGMMESFHTGLEAGRWVTYQTERQYSLGKRHVINPSLLHLPGHWSDTRPLALHMEYTDETFMVDTESLS